MLADTLGHIFDVPLRLTPSAIGVIQGGTVLTEPRARVLPLERAADGGWAMERREVIGKVVIRP